MSRNTLKFGYKPSVLLPFQLCARKRGLCLLLRKLIKSCQYCGDEVHSCRCKRGPEGVNDLVPVDKPLLLVTSPTRFLDIQEVTGSLVTSISASDVLSVSNIKENLSRPSSFQFEQQLTGKSEHETLNHVSDKENEESAIDGHDTEPESPVSVLDTSELQVQISSGTVRPSAAMSVTPVTRLNRSEQLFEFPLPKREVSGSKYSSSTSNSVSSEIGSASDVEKQLYFNKMKLEIELQRERSKIRFLESQLETREEAIKQHEADIKELRDECRRFSKLNADLSDRLLQVLSSNTEMKKQVNQNVSGMSSGLNLPVETLPEPFSPPVIRKTSNANKDCAKKNLFPSKVQEDDHDTSDSDNFEDSTPSVSSSKTPNSFTKTEKKPEVSAKKEKKAAKSPKCEDGVTPNSELYKMILQALQGKAPLQHDGNGKVHIGNGIWIAEKTWDDKIRKANVSPSIAVRDVMSKIYTPAEIAERSLEGATPVKPNSSGQKIYKKKMTPQKTEAVLGVFRAKTVAASGSEDPFFLDLAVSKKGKDTIKYKLKEAASALKPKD